VIERQAGEGLADLDAAAEHGYLIFGEYLRQHAAQNDRAARRVFRHLDHHAVARGQCRDQRTHGFDDRKIPGGDHTHHALGLIDHLGAVREEHQIGMAPARLHPALEMAQRVVDLQRRREQVQHLAFELRSTTEVVAHRLRELVLVALQADPQRPQIVPSLRRFGIRQGEAGLALACERGIQAVE